MDQPENAFNPDQVAIRPMEPRDVEAAVQCFDDHYDVFDAPVSVAAFLRTYPDAFYVATIPSGDSDHVIGVCASPIGPQNTAFFGLYGLRVGYRSFGIGSRLFQRCLDYIGSDRSVGLYAVPEMRKKYMDRGGFSNAEGICMVNFVGIPSELHMVKLKSLLSDCSSGYEAQFISTDGHNEELLRQIIDYDYEIHWESREALLKNALPSKGYLTCAVFSSGQMKGYGCIREHQFTKRQLLGPLYADTAEAARQVAARLLCALAPEKIQNGIILNALDSQPESLNLASEWLGIEEIERCERLFRGNCIKANFERIYGVFSMDFSL